MPHPLDFLLPCAGQQHCDCTLVLLLPPAERKAHKEDGGTPDADRQQADQHEQQGDERRDAQQDESKGPAAKRQKAEQQSVDGPQHQQPPEQRRVSLQTSSTLLALYSEKFRDWIARWMNGAAEKELEVHCRSEGEVAGYRHLLAFMHSMGKEVPQAAEELIQLLLLAREHAVEPAVLACLQRLQQQVPSMPATACLALLLVLETGVSGGGSLQAEADKLEADLFKQLCTLLAAGGAVPDAASRRQLLLFLGPLQDILNHERRREVFAGIPFGLLRDCIFADENVDADTEATVLAAFAYWAERNIKDTEPDARQRIAAICSLIRFPDIPASVLHSYHLCHSFMRTFDPDRELLLLAVSRRSPIHCQAGMTHCSALAEAQIASAAEPSQAARWKQLMAEGSANALKANCERWWQPRPRPLGPYSELQSASFEFKPASKSDNDEYVYTEYCYWGGYYWRIKFGKREANLDVYVVSSVRHDPPFFVKESETLPGIQVEYTVWLCAANSTSDLEAVSGTDYFEPCAGYGWGYSAVREAPEHGDQPITWDGFWAEGSRFMHNCFMRRPHAPAAAPALQLVHALVHPGLLMPSVFSTTDCMYHGLHL